MPTSVRIMIKTNQRLLTLKLKTRLRMKLQMLTRIPQLLLKPAAVDLRAWEDWDDLDTTSKNWLTLTTLMPSRGGALGHVGEYLGWRRRNVREDLDDNQYLRNLPLSQKLPLEDQKEQKKSPAGACVRGRKTTYRAMRKRRPALRSLQPKNILLEYRKATLFENGIAKNVIPAIIEAMITTKARWYSVKGVLVPTTSNV
jgi:hypothetical protein